MTELPSSAALPEHCDFVVFGGTGDLALRKLLPALLHRDREGQLPPDFRIVGVSREPVDDVGYRALVATALRQHLAAHEIDPDVEERLLARLHHLCLDAHDPADWHRLAGLLKDDRPDDAVRVYYLALAPALFGEVCHQLDRLGLVTANSRVVMEKPIGHDLASARAINDAVGEVFAESQIFRIDHYLGKESVQNLLVTRFANILLEPLWTSRWIDHVEITVAEALGVGQRGPYYDQAGALRDMVQNHLLQLLCLVAMEPPTHVAADTVRNEKLKVLQALKPLTAVDVARDVVRGQYQGYADEIGHPSGTETFVALRTEVQNWRWAGVPFYLRTGKRLAARASQIVVVFKAPPHAMFPGADGETAANRLHILVQPEEGMRMHLTAKEPGPGGYRLKPVSLDLRHADAFETRAPEAYERLLMDVVRGNATLFMRRDEVEAAWTWVTPILQSWEDADRAGERPLIYPAGTTGPAAADALLTRDGRTWQELDT